MKRSTSSRQARQVLLAVVGAKLRMRPVGPAVELNGESERRPRQVEPEASDAMLARRGRDASVAEQLKQ